MANTTKKQTIVLVSLVTLFLGIVGLFSVVTAHGVHEELSLGGEENTAVNQEIENLNQEIDDRKAKLDEVNRKKKELEEQLTIIQRETYSIENQIRAIDTQIADTEYEIQKKTIEIEQRKLEIERLAELIGLKEIEIKETKTRLSSLIRVIDEQDRQSPLYVLFSRDSFSSYLEDIQSAAELQVRVQNEVSLLKHAKEDLDTQKVEQEDVTNQLKEAKESLEINTNTLAQQKQYQEGLYQRSREEAVPYETLIAEASRQQATIDAQVAQLESQARSKLLSLNNGIISDKNVPLAWPISSLDKPGLSSSTCLSHVTCTAVYGYDSNYFSGVFHRGIDIAVPQGTPVYAPADGIVAYPFNPGGVCPYAWWNCIGYESSLYLQHVDEGGQPTDMYTQYLHLSAAAVTYSPDITYVKQGQVIGYIGGKPGTSGAGFSTGSHLHFAVIFGGRPGAGGQYVNPLHYLP